MALIPATSRSVVLFAALLFTSIFVLFQIYALAFPFGSSFDDAWNLRDLEQVQDRVSALEFVFGGLSGPLGRPLALATFLPRAASWPSAPQDFLYENTLFHLLNAVLLTWFAYRLARHLPWPIASPHYFALAIGFWWASSPLLFSTSVMIIQRMTSLSAMFCLAGCLGYLIARQQIEISPRRVLLLMSASVIAGTVLATVSKENGVLLPGFVLLLESTLLSQQPTGVRLGVWFWRWKLVFLFLPVLALIAYFAMHVPSYIVGYQTREFTFDQRLLTESRIMIKYVKLLLLPVRSELGPYHDDYPLSSGVYEPPSTALALATLSCSIVLAWRLRRGPFCLVSFAVSWFLWGHLTESTIVPLELYFEHRNYLPSVGPAIALLGAVFHPRIGRALRTVVLTLMLGCSLFILRECALTWGDKGVAAYAWYHRHPASLRSLQLVLNTLLEQGLVNEYVNLVDSVPPPLDSTSELAITRVVAYCGVRGPQEISAAVAMATERLRTVPSSSSVTQLLDRLADVAGTSQCPGLHAADVKMLLGAVISNESPRTRRDTHAQAHEIYGRLLLSEGDLAGTIEHLEQAFRLRPTLATGITMASLLTANDRFDEAERKLHALEPFEPHRPYVRKRWLDTIHEMQEIIRESRQKMSGL